MVYPKFVVNLQEVRKGLAELRDGLARIRQELAEHFANTDDNDRYGRQMWSFIGKAGHQVDDLIDDINAADSTFTEVVKYYGEDEKNMSSSEFYGIFKTFVTSYKVCSINFMAYYSSTRPRRNANQTIRL
jgi:cytokinesis protein